MRFLVDQNRSPRVGRRVPARTGYGRIGLGDIPASGCGADCPCGPPHHAGVANLFMSIPAAPNDLHEALALIDRFADLPSRLDDDTKRLWELVVRCHTWGMQGDKDRGASYANEALDIGRRIGYEHWIMLGPVQVIRTRSRHSQADHGSRAGASRVVNLAVLAGPAECCRAGQGRNCLARGLRTSQLVQPRVRQAGFLLRHVQQARRVLRSSPLQRPPQG